MNMSPRWGEESWRGTIGYKHVTPLRGEERISLSPAFPVGCGYAALRLCGSPTSRIGPMGRLV
jgi:hypothetical protein